MALTMALAACLASCSSDDSREEMASLPKKMTINVVDNQGFLSSKETTPQDNVTRALPAQYQADDDIKRGTVFEMGDAIGIYEVDASGNVTAANVPYYFTGQVWDSATGLDFDDNKHYFAYFPYKEDLTGLNAPALNDNVSTSMTDAATFFSGLTSNWEILPNQQSYENYKASDLMVGEGIATITDGNTVVNFTMSHQMGLVVLDLGQVKHMLRSGRYYWFDQVNRKCKSETGFFVPSYIMDEYRAIIPLNQKTKFCATDDEWAVSAYISQPGHYQKYLIGYTTANESAGIQYFDLQPGDIYYSDGSLMHVTADNFDARMARSADALGFVVFVSDGSAEDQKVVDPTLDENGMLKCQYSHGLVLKIEGRYTYDPYDFANTKAGSDISKVMYQYQQAGHTLKKYYSIGSAVNDFDGARTSDMVVGTNADYDTWYGNVHPGPAGTNVPNTGWFVPGMGQIVHSMLKTGVITQETYNSLASTTGRNRVKNIAMNGSIWGQYLVNAIGTTSLSVTSSFSFEYDNNYFTVMAMLTSTYNPFNPWDSFNYCITIPSVDTTQGCIHTSNNISGSSSRKGNTPFMLAF